jgi:hypothetical protein
MPPLLWGKYLLLMQKPPAWHRPDVREETLGRLLFRHGTPYGIGISVLPNFSLPVYSWISATLAPQMGGKPVGLA